MHNDTSAPLHICPDCVNRVNGDPAPVPDGWEYDWSIARYGKITTTGARYVESSDSHTGGCELCMEDHEDGLREVWAAPLTNTSTTPLTTHEDVPVADSPGDVTTRTIPLDGGTAVVEHVEDRVEVTIRIGARIVAALALSHTEADMLGMAIARPGGADAMHADASTLAHAWGTAQAV